MDLVWPRLTARALPNITELTTNTFAALRATKMSALWKKADGRGGDALRQRLARLTNCANYLVCIGSIDVAERRSHQVIEPKLLRCLPGAIFAYQLDWRYPKPFGITMGGLDAATPDVALRRAFPHAFFELLERCPSYFASGSAQPVASYMVELTRHLLGKDVAPYNSWLDSLLDRLERVATNPAPEASSTIYDYPTREDWQAAAEIRHGRPLPVELLDTSLEPPPDKSWPSLVAATFALLSPDTNPLLQPHDVLRVKGLAAPYQRSPELGAGSPRG